MTQAVDWSKIGVRIVQGLNTTIDAVRQLDTQEAALVMKLLGKTCTKMMKEGVGHQFGIAMIEASEKLALKDKLVFEDVLKMLTGIIGKLYFSAKTAEEVDLVKQLEDAVKNYQVV
ncbi:MAG: recombinase [Peptococcaceae bacterium]|nr:recombinase [Peptococcaceae bacterium]